MTVIRVLVADDHTLVRAGLCALIGQLPEIEIVGEAANGHEAVERVAELRPRVALINISMPQLNGLEATRQINASHPATRVLVVSMHADEEYVRRALALGAAGYLVKCAERAELALAIRALARGDTWLSPSVSKGVAAALARGDVAAGPFELLTPRQREILQFVAEGYSSKETAARLGLSTKTVESHRAQLMLRLGVQSVAGLVRAAVRLGIVQA